MHGRIWRVQTKGEAMELFAETTLQDEFRRSLIAKGSSWRATAVIFVVTAVLVVVLKPILDGEVSSGMLFMLGITLVGARAGLMPALASAILASAIFNFFLADPVLTFRMSHGEDLAPPIIFTACAVVSGLLAGRLKDKTHQLGQTNLQLESLLETSRMLQAAADVPAIEAALVANVPGRLGFRLSLYVLLDGVIQALPASDCSKSTLQMAQRAIHSEGMLQQGDYLAFRLDGSRSCVGALVIENAGVAQVDRAFLEALASLVGLALERARFASIVAEAEANQRTEELKSALLSSVSHDLRTPLTAISASASSLIEFGTQLDFETSTALLQGIVEECDRLNRFTANLLELSRLQADGPAITGQALCVNDVIRSAIQRLRPRFPGREIMVDSRDPEILVHADSALFELALANVVQNALIYSPPDSAVVIRNTRQDRRCILTVTDQGLGIPQADKERVFERFYRVKRGESSPQGSGLGLAIAKGFVEAFAGKIRLTSPSENGRGTTVTIDLPILAEAQG